MTTRRFQVKNRSMQHVPKTTRCLSFPHMLLLANSRKEKSLQHVNIIVIHWTVCTSSTVNLLK